MKPVLTQAQREWNRGGSADGLNPTIDDREFVGNLLSRAPKYDPSRGSGREYVWTDDAQCSDVDPELFQVAVQGDPEVAGMNNPQIKAYNLAKMEKARTVCDGCPVLQTCLAEAEPSDRFWSVRGGELPTKLTNKRGVNRPPTWDMSGYDVPWSCPNHGTEFKRDYQRGEGRQVYCDACRNR